MDKNEAKLLKETIASLEKKLKERTAELKKQSRALAIETALEKVSRRTVSMRKSDELSETSAILFQQLKELDIDVIQPGSASLMMPTMPSRTLAHHRFQWRWGHEDTRLLQPARPPRI